MSAPPHDPELFDELMRTELRRQPVSRYAIATLVFGLLGGLLVPVFAAVALVRIKKHRQRGLLLVICGLVAFAAWTGVVVYQVATGSAWWQQPRREQLPAGEAHGLDVTTGQCFWSPTGTGEVSVLLTPCTDPHTAEAFAVLPLAAGSMPDIGESYQQTLDRCAAAAHPIAGARVQVMTPATGSGGKHRAVCYYRFGTEMTAPAR